MDESDCGGACEQSGVAWRSFVHLHRTPSSRCSTGRPGSATSSPRRRPTASRRSGSPTTATCTGSSTSTRSATPRASSRSSAPRRTWPASPAHERPVRRGRIDDAGGEGERGEKLYYHLTAAGRDQRQGYRNLMKLSSGAYLEGYYYKPRVDWELLERHHEGIIATTGCLGGVVLQALLQRRRSTGALEPAARLQDIFGRDNLFVELQDHGLPEQQRDQPAARSRSPARIGAPLLATNDSHYMPPRRRRRPRRPAVRADRLADGRPEPLQVPRRRALPEDGGRDALAVRRAARGVRQHLVDRRAGQRRDRVRQARSCPTFPLPDGFADARADVPAPPHLRGGRASATATRCRAEVVERLDYELGVIERHGVHRLLPRRVGPHPPRPRPTASGSGPGRGSAAGCCVAYCLRIVDLDPIRYDLLFERFLNPGRKQMPDIDMDFD